MPTLKVESLQTVSTTFTVEITKDVPYLDSLVVYFDIRFEQDATSPVVFSTGPHVQPTHWKQTVLIFKDPLPVKVGDKVIGELHFKQNRQSFRDLDLTLKYHSSAAPNVVLTQEFFVS